MAAAKKHLDTIIAIASCHCQKLWLCLKSILWKMCYYLYMFKEIKLFLLLLFYFIFIYFLFVYYSFLFIIVFDASYMLLHVLCSKIEMKKLILFILKSREILRDFPCSQSVLWLKICWCVLSSSHRSTPHTIGANRFNLGFFLSSCVWSLIFSYSYTMEDPIISYIL